MPFQGPQVVQSDLPRRTVHKAHVDGPTMPVYGEAAHTARPGCRGIDLPPIAHDRGFTLILKRGVGRIRMVRGLTSVPSTITQYGDAAGVLAEVGFPMQLRCIQPPVIARL